MVAAGTPAAVSGACADGCVVQEPQNWELRGPYTLTAKAEAVLDGPEPEAEP